MKKAAFVLLMAFSTGLFTCLGIWQFERLAWKHDLIALTERKLSEDPVDAPGRSRWASLTPDWQYTRVHLHGTYLQDNNTFVLASTIYGRGYWVLTPLRTRDFTVLVNRGFVLPHERDNLSSPPGEVSVNGLLRLSEPGGSLLQRNDPESGRWYSRDVRAIADHAGLTGVAPYFVDESAAGNDPEIPRRGLTVVQFRNNHLQYALTWFILAGISLAGLVLTLVKGRWKL